MSETSVNRAERRGSEPPALSICVPQYNRTSFLMAACRTYAAQTFSSFELCISDDCSTDGRADELLAYLRGSGLDFVWELRPRNVRYDGNLRAALALARGRHALIMGNDDGLAGPEALAQLHLALPADGPAVGLVNYADAVTGRVFRRVRTGGYLGSGASLATARFRDFSFVSGVVLPVPESQALANERWDGVEFYQTWLACRLVATGTPLVAVEAPLVVKDLHVPGEMVESYATTAPRDRGFRERNLNLVRVPGLVADALAPAVSPARLRGLAASVVAQTYAITYGYWLVEYRRVRSWSYAAGVAWGMRPARVLVGVPLSLTGRLGLRLLWAGVSVVGLLLPIRIARMLETRLYALAKALRPYRSNGVDG